MRKRIRVAVAATAAGALLALTACGTKLQDTPAPTSSLLYWGKWAKGTPQATLFEQVIADYAKERGVRVDVQWLGNGQEDQVETAIATGQGPDLFDTAIDHTAGFRAAGALGDLSAVFRTKIPGESATIEEVLPKSVLKAISDDKGYGFVPHSVFSIGLWYDAARHPGFATAPPKTFADFMATARKEKAAGRQPIALDGTINSYNAFWLYQILLTTAGPGSLRRLAEDPAAWDDPKVKKAVTEVESLVEAGLFQPDHMATKFPEAQNAWAAGEHTFNLNGTWLGSETASLRVKAVQPRVISLPPVDPAKGSIVTVGALGWGVNPGSKNQRAVADFLAFAMQRKYIDRIATDAANIPARADSPAPDELTAIQRAIREATEISLDFDGVATVRPKWYNDVFLPLDDKLIGGSIDAATFLSEGKSRTAALASD
ncbi:ABC transporter substrate-binding protein [Nonomuraea sp. NPDC050540]|uniref:ABC transporter substrate-binding protein n=1 Tax=Nonomuraea sp. NPDC050540 TaxID=3364367 RepID=UPI00379384BF